MLDFYSCSNVRALGTLQDKSAAVRCVVNIHCIQTFHVNCSLLKCQDIATLSPVYSLCIGVGIGHFINNTMIYALTLM